MFVNKNMISVDIGSSSIKVMDGGGSKAIKNIGFEILPKGIVDNGMIQDSKMIEQILMKLLSRLGISLRNRRVSLSLSSSSVLIKRVTFPKNDETDIIEVIFSDAHKHLEVDMDDIYFDYHILDNKDDAPEFSVVLVGANRSILDQNMNIIKNIGLNLGVIDVDIFALINMLEFNYGKTKELSALINFGASSTQIILINLGEYVFSRLITLGGGDYTSKISEHMNIPLESAELMKITKSSEKQNVSSNLHSIFQEVNNQLVEEIATTIDYFISSSENNTNKKSIDSFFISGGAAPTYNLAKTVSQKFSKKTTIINPFSKSKIHKNKQEYVAKNGQYFGIASGLSLRKFSFSK